MYESEEITLKDMWNELPWHGKILVPLAGLFVSTFPVSIMFLVLLTEKIGL